jgi:molecular chaperone IbpA
MRSSIYAPFFRSTVGFDRLFDMIENSVRTDWPPYNIEKMSDNDYRITMAVAGFGPEDIELTQHGPELIVTGQKATEDNDRQILHRGLAGGNFRQVFKLANHVRVTNARLDNGLLAIDLAIEIPEEMKPRRVAITGEAAAPWSAGGEPEQIAQDVKPRRKAA